MEETRIIKRVGNYSTFQAKPNDCIICNNAKYATVIIDDICLDCTLKDLQHHENSSIYITESQEGELDKNGKPTGKRSRVLWLNFKGKKGNHAMVNLNNIACERGYVVKKAMRDAIEDY